MEILIGSVAILLYLSIVISCALLGIGWIARKRPGLPGKIITVAIVLFVAYAIPFGDETVGFIRFRQLCSEQMGEKIINTANDVDGILWGSGRRAKPYSTYGFRFHETKARNGDVYRYIRSEDGSVYEEIDKYPKAKYIVRQSSWVQISNHFARMDFTIERSANAELLAVHSMIHYDGGWLRRSLKGIGVNGPTCPEKQIDYVRFIQSVLKANE